jgi:hypothetical protein
MHRLLRVGEDDDQPLVRFRGGTEGHETHFV